MPLKDDDSIENQIKHGKHLTFVDKMRAGFKPSIGEDEMGRVVNPREEFLRSQAAERKRQYDDEQRRIAANKKK